MAILLDPSAVVAAADVADLNHRAAVAWFSRVDEPLLLGALGLAELDLLLQRELGVAATEAVLQALIADAIRLVSPTTEDLARAVVLMREAAEHRPQLADALLVATAERLGIRGSRASTGARSRSSARVTCGHWSSSPRNRDGAGGAGPVRGRLRDRWGALGDALDDHRAGLDVVEALALGAPWYVVQIRKTK